MRMYTFTILYWAYIVAISIHFVASLTSAAKTPRPTFAAGTVLSLHMERFLRTAVSEDRTFVCHSMEEHYEYVPDMHVYLAALASIAYVARIKLHVSHVRTVIVSPSFCMLASNASHTYDNKADY